MHILIKFFSQKSYIREFVSGKLYMNSLDYFWNNGWSYSVYDEGNSGKNTEKSVGAVEGHTSGSLGAERNL